ncbi:hypothetical protein A7985_10265 [Pseudoalteromonas luteoviolacea]|uniref:Uncharacterized protein n=1 Tax=Pseudoalteromonas luteoviolacea TaxID=43657 RepID=A0A1C0TST3_9GAMM|nr:hypothetical protein [Pseudoalteromonas luteoviolacea]MBQ4810823.1 hypothetical protein [Pseudoalteromonas luteoviolacea]OCQ22164.1 hypothetical protein A7985_10265 [Pseudoalteromonas luteoviolacea]
MKLTSIAMKLFTSAVICAASLSAHAGYKQTGNVEVSSTTIKGSFGSARNSSDSKQILSISDYGNFVLIFAKNSAGSIKTCTTSDQTKKEQLRGATSDSYLIIGLSGSTCSSVYVDNSSKHEAKR